ncbi:antibiotic biosynthesis monooxygenase [Palaeococcus sp. (in: euryarchaeotes)]
MAIMRLWHGRVPIEKADEYERFLIERAVPDYSSVDGLLKLYFTRKDENKVAHFLLITIWDSMESIKKFACPNSQSIIQKTMNFCWKRRNMSPCTGYFMRSEHPMR